MSASLSLLALAGNSAAGAQASAQQVTPSSARTTPAPPAGLASPPPAQLPGVATLPPGASTTSPAENAAAAGTSPPTSATAFNSQSNPALPQLTLDQVIAQVLNANPTIVQARLARQRAHVLVAEAVGQTRPQLNVTAFDTYSSTPTSAAEAGQTPTVNSTTSIPVIQDSAFGNVGTSVSSSSGAGTLSTGNAESDTTASGTTIVPVGGLPTSGSGGSSSGSSGIISGSSGAGSSSTSGATSGGGTSTTTTGTSAQVIDDGAKPAPRQGGGTTGSGSGSGTTTGSGTSTGDNFVSVKQRVNNYAANASATQIIDLFGIAKANVDAAKRNADFSDLDVTRLENDTALNAKDTYFAVLKAVSDVATDTELLNNANAVLNNAQINYKAGASPQFDVISSQAEVSSAQASLINARNELQVEKAILDNLMSLPTSYDFNLGSVPVINVPDATPVDPLVTTANAGRPEILESNLTQQIARDLTRISREDSLPSVGLSGGVDYQPYLEADSKTSHYTGFLTASVSFPLYTGGTARAEVSAARINEANQQSVDIEIRQDVELEVRSALINVITYQNLVAADTAAVGEYREALRIANVRYTAQVGTLLDVTNAQANLANSESNLNSAVFQQQSAYASLLRAEGKR